jgi:succinoglycan biosynthesis transport protein ExoP
MNNQRRMQLQNRSNRKMPAAGNPRRGSREFDWLGAIIRRKWILLPFVIAGLGIGYFSYSKKQPKYASSLNLMIWTQSPPAIVNGEVMVQPVPLGKHQALLTSQVVLNNAIEKGDLRWMKSFAPKLDPLSQLKKNLSAEPIEDVDDTLVLTLKGPNAEELPTILFQIVAAYQSIINEDTAAVGKESVDLIAKFQERLVEEKKIAEKRHAELIQKLVISSDPRTGVFMNPSLLSVDQLKTQIAVLERSYRETIDRIDSLLDIQSFPSEKRSELVKAVALEAAKYLSLRAEEDVVSAEFRFDKDDRQRLYSQLGSRISTLENNLAELKLRRSQLILNDRGDQHPDVLRIRTEQDFIATQLAELTEQQRQLRSRIQSDETSSKEKADSAETNSLLNLNRYDQELVKVYYASLNRESERLRKSIAGLEEEVIQEDKKAVEVGIEIGELNMLATEIKDKDLQLRGIVDRLSEIALVASNYSSTKVRVIDDPGIGYQVEPKLYLDLSVAGFLGTLVGLGLIFLLDWADMSYRSPAEIEEKLGIPVVGNIPYILANPGEMAVLPTATNKSSRYFEAYRSCRTTILFLANAHNLKSILITSPCAGDGKSTTATNLAICFAQAGYKTVLVDADLRRPRCHEYLSEPKAPGVKDLVDGSTDYRSLIKPCAQIDNLSFIASGGQPSCPTELLESAQFKQLMSDLKSEFDFIIVDSPPVLPVADATVLAKMCDMVFLVVKIRRGVELAAAKTTKILRLVEGNVQGVIVNSADKKSHYSDYGKYGYNGYGGYKYYASRYYEKDNEKYYSAAPEKGLTEEKPV